MAETSYIQYIPPNVPPIGSLTTSSYRYPPPQQNLPPVNSPSISESEITTSFRNSICQENLDEHFIQEYTIRLFTKYLDNARDYRDFALWEWIHFDFEDFSVHHWDLLRSDHWDLVHKVCYSQGIWLNHPGKKRSRAQAMYNMVQKDYYEDWTIEQINWVERQYNTLSSVVRNRKEKLLKASALSQRYASSPPLAVSQRSFSSNLEFFPPPEVQSERLFQQPVYYLTWN